MGLEPFKDHAKSSARSGWVRDSDVAKGHRAPPKDFAMATKLFAKVELIEELATASDAFARRRFVSMAQQQQQQTPHVNTASQYNTKQYNTHNFKNKTPFY